MSKLQLLRCGNDYIRVLKGRVERRDDEIDMLRKEVARLRIVAGGDCDGEEIDLERDLDAAEATIGGIFGKAMGGIPEEDEEQDDCGGM